MLKRKYARLTIVLFVAGLLLICICPIAKHLGLVCEIASCVSGFVLFVASLVIRIIFLKCPTCRKAIPSPQWSKNGTILCVKCGERFIYDE